MWLSQIVLITLINLQITANGNAYANLGNFPTSSWVVIARFICCIVLHMALGDELAQGLNCMKYAINHPYRFANWRLACFCGFLQCSSVMFNESINILAILYSTDVMSVVMNFLALVVISDFDDFFYSGLRNESWKDFLTGETYTELLMITRTTSYRAKEESELHRITETAIQTKNPTLYAQLKESGEIPDFIYQNFWTRKIINQLFFIGYRILRLIYVSVWFYFLPFTILFGSYYVPYWLQVYNENKMAEE